jgi:hypothetical protein
MQKEMDVISNRIIEILNKADKPMETKEIEMLLKNVTRIKTLYRLHNLRGEGMIKGRAFGSGKGTWIWWRKDAFR